MEKIKHLLLLILVLFVLSVGFSDTVSEKITETENETECENADIPASDDLRTSFFTESTLPVDSVEHPAATCQTTVIVRQLSNFSFYRELNQNLFTKIKSIHITCISRHVSSLRFSYGLLVFGLMKIRV